MAGARKFRIEKAHVENALAKDPDLSGVLPKIGYIVFPFGDKNATPYDVDGFKVTVMTEVSTSSTAPFVADKKLAFLLIGTDFSKDPSVIPYQEFLRKKGYGKPQILNALVASHIHHEAIHVRLQMDFVIADFKIIKDITKEYFFTFIHLNRTKEGAALLTAIRAMAKNAVMPDDKADVFARTELEKFTQEKFAFSRVNRMTDGLFVKNALIEESYFRRFEATLDSAGGPAYMRMKSNSLFARTYAGLKNTAMNALSAFFAKYDADIKP